MVRSCSSLALCVLLMAGLAVAQQHGRAQQLTPQRQQQLPQQYQQQPRPPPGSLSLIPEDLSLTDVTDGQLQRFLANEGTVSVLTDCFIEPRQCSTKAGINLIKQVRSLGIGGRCKTCSPQEQDKLNQNIYDFILTYQNRYPTYWRRVLPHLGVLITAVPNN